jgi:peptidoglycan/xylan/chitin deacetylase (PgdA/CDA1 family)
VRFRPAMCLLVAIVMVAGACSSATPTPSAGTSVAPGSSLAPGVSIGPGASGPTTSFPVGPGESVEPGASPTASTETPGPGSSETPGPAKTPKPPKPLDSYVTHGKRKGEPKMIALTFDADMYPFMYANIDNYTEYDKRVIKLLKDENVHATIFANGLYLKAYPDLIKELAKQPGIEIGNHSWDHGSWPGCGAKDPLAPPVTDKKAEIEKAAKIIEETVGYAPDWFRFPGFCYSAQSDLDLVKSYGEWPIGNDCFFGDSAGWSAAQQISSVKNGCQNGSIVVTHLNNEKYHPNIYDALKVLIPWWKDNGWQVVNISELLGQKPPKP